MLSNIDHIRQKMETAYKKAAAQGGWRTVGKQFGISGGMAFRIVKQQYEPKQPKIRTTLGLPAMTEVPVCHKCGEVHLKKGCPKSIHRKKDLFSFSETELRWMFEHRKDTR